MLNCKWKSLLSSIFPLATRAMPREPGTRCQHMPSFHRARNQLATRAGAPLARMHSVSLGTVRSKKWHWLTLATQGLFEIKVCSPRPVIFNSWSRTYARFLIRRLGHVHKLTSLLKVKPNKFTQYSKKHMITEVVHATYYYLKTASYPDTRTRFYEWTHIMYMVSPLALLARHQSLAPRARLQQICQTPEEKETEEERMLTSKHK